MAAALGPEPMISTDSLISTVAANQETTFLFVHMTSWYADAFYKNLSNVSSLTQKLFGNIEM
jgi:hypothetical protein